MHLHRPYLITLVFLYANSGDVFLFWFGTKPTICIKDVNIVKNILSNKFDDYIKDTPKPHLLSMLGKGLLFAEGDHWARHRKVVRQAFTMEKLKVYIYIYIDDVLRT